MLAARVVRFSRSDPLSGLDVGEHPDPQAPEGWEVVAVRAASVNHHDVWTLRGVGASDEDLPVVLGCDAAGLTAGGREVIVHAVVADPDGDETLAADRRLLSEGIDGTFAENVAVPARNLVDKPAELSFAQAACLPTAWLTAYRALFTRAGLRPGDRLLIQGAGGGLATAATLLARAAGVQVTVTSRTAEKRKRALDLGAHAAVEPGARLPEGVDVVLESVGEATWDHSLKVLRPGGTVVVVGATSGPNPPADLPRVFFRQLRVVGSTMGTRGELQALIRFLLASGIRPVIDEVFRLEEAGQALERMVSGDLFGKLVLRISD